MKPKTIKLELSQIGSTVIVEFIPLIDDEQTKQNCFQSAKNLYDSVESIALKGLALDLESSWRDRS